MCASYTAPPESVSTRMIVAPGTAALAAAVAFVALPSVSNVSFGPWFTVAGSTPLAGAVAAGVLAVAVGVAAPATWVPARIPPATRPLAINPAEARILLRRAGGTVSIGVSLLLSISLSFTPSDARH